MKTQTISLQTSPDELRALFRASRGTLPAIIAASISPAALLQIIERHRGEEYYGALLQIVVMHAAANDDLFDLIIDRENDPGVLSAIATSGQASSRTLHRLAATEHESVREHAILGILRENLDTADSEQFGEVLRQHQGEGGIDLGVRSMLASHPRTPQAVIEQLAEDDVDFIREAALTRRSRH